MTTRVSIRPATTTDVSAIQALYRQLDQHHVRLLPDYFREVDGDIRPDSLVEDWIARQDADYLLAETDGAVVGFVSVECASSPDLPMFQPRPFAHIENAVVNVDCRRAGIGLALFDAAVKWTRQRGIKHIRLGVWSANTTAREFYLNRGFQPLTEKLELDLEESGE